MSHYYTNDPSLKSDIQTITYTYKGNILTLTSNTGVFSKKRVDFGTNLLLNSLDEELSNKKILDIGCGYGIIGLSIAKAYKDSFVDMIDVNLRAVELAKTNSINNKIDNVEIYESSLYDNVKKEFDVIISNPPIRAGKAVVHGIVSEGYKYLTIGGEIWIVIQKKQGAESMMKKMEEIFSNVKIINKDKGYYILKSVKE